MIISLTRKLYNLFCTNQCKLVLVTLKQWQRLFASRPKMWVWVTGMNIFPKVGERLPTYYCLHTESLAADLCTGYEFPFEIMRCYFICNWMCYVRSVEKLLAADFCTGYEFPFEIIRCYFICNLMCYVCSVEKILIFSF